MENKEDIRLLNSEQLEQFFVDKNHKKFITSDFDTNWLGKEKFY